MLPHPDKFMRSCPRLCIAPPPRPPYFSATRVTVLRFHRNMVALSSQENNVLTSLPNGTFASCSNLTELRLVSCLAYDRVCSGTDCAAHLAGLPCTTQKSKKMSRLGVSFKLAAERRTDCGRAMSSHARWCRNARAPAAMALTDLRRACYLWLRLPLFISGARRPVNYATAPRFLPFLSVTNCRTTIF
jgi:hypothetical protein